MTCKSILLRTCRVVVVHHQKMELFLTVSLVHRSLLVRCEEPCLVGNSLFGGLRSALFPGFFIRMCFIVFRLEGLECQESISDNFLMICFHLLSQVFVPVLPEIACLSPWFIVYVMPCVCYQNVVNQIHCYSVLHFPVLPPARINYRVCGQSSGGIVQARHSAKDTFLFRIVPCDDLLSLISDYKRPGGKCRILSCQNF